MQQADNGNRVGDTGLMTTSTGLAPSESLPICHLLRRVSPETPVERIPVTGPIFRVGRNSQNQLCLSDRTVSNYHAEIAIIENDLFVKDLGSTNGTFVNGQRVKDLRELRDGDQVHFGTVVFEISTENQSLSENATAVTDVEPDVLAHVQFDKLINDPALFPFFQPVVRLGSQECVGYEVLVRSRLIGLELPDKMFRIAAQRDSESALSRLSRHEGVWVAHEYGLCGEIYLNTHPAELRDPSFFESLETLRESFPAMNLILEVHESAITSTAYLRELRSCLKDLRMGLAYDDFGAGQARLMELTEVPPDVLKFDRKFVQAISSGLPQQLETIASLVRIVQQLGAVSLIEGVETVAEADRCRELGFELAQGYFFGRPGPIKTWSVLPPIQPSTSATPLPLT